MIAEEIAASRLPDRVKARSIAIFREIARGEARVHGVEIDDVHFHEVGAVDSIVDIVGVALALENLGIETVYSTPVHLGSGGMIRSQHGMIPIPAPATLEILKGFPVVSTPLHSEMTTPTGAGIVAALVEAEGPSGAHTIEGTGFGGGTKEFPDRPNLLRVVIGTTGEQSVAPDRESDQIVQLAANVDDMSPEGWPVAFDRIFAAGALDVWLTQTLMKKGRPGAQLSVLVAPENRRSVEEAIFSSTTTIGIRRCQVDRTKLRRRSETVETAFGPVRTKVVLTPNGEECRPEADEIARIAAEQGLSFSEAERRILGSIDTSGR